MCTPTATRTGGEQSAGNARRRFGGSWGAGGGQQGRRGGCGPQGLGSGWSRCGGGCVVWAPGLREWVARRWVTPHAAGMARGLTRGCCWCGTPSTTHQTQPSSPSTLASAPAQTPPPLLRRFPLDCLANRPTVNRRQPPPCRDIKPLNVLIATNPHLAAASGAGQAAAGRAGQRPQRPVFDLEAGLSASAVGSGNGGDRDANWR